MHGSAGHEPAQDQGHACSRRDFTMEVRIRDDFPELHLRRRPRAHIRVRRPVDEVVLVQDDRGIIWDDRAPVALGRGDVPRPFILPGKAEKIAALAAEPAALDPAFEGSLSVVAIAVGRSRGWCEVVRGHGLGSYTDARFHVAHRRVSPWLGWLREPRNVSHAARGGPEAEASASKASTCTRSRSTSESARSPTAGA